MLKNLTVGEKWNFGTFATALALTLAALTYIYFDHLINAEAYAQRHMDIPFGTATILQVLAIIAAAIISTVVITSIVFTHSFEREKPVKMKPILIWYALPALMIAASFLVLTTVVCCPICTSESF
jgi:hypothetical protein